MKGEEAVKELYIETKDGEVKRIPYVEEWGWWKEKGTIYYRKGGWIYKKEVKRIVEFGKRRKRGIGR